MKQSVLTLTLLAVLQLSAFAQTPITTDCGTVIPAHPERLLQLKHISENAQLRGPQQTTKVIPVVFHIIHDNTTATNISREKVLDGLRMLNEDFNKQNPDTALVIQPFKHLIADVQVEFRLATLDPNGNCTQGITRNYSPLTHAANDNVKSLVQWDPEKYLNIWVANTLSSGAGAYSSFPCGNPAIDGIVARADRIGFTYSHTISHEVGHYFGLQHIWGWGPVGQAGSCSQDDGIADTPNTIGGSTPVCNLNQVHCGNLVNIQNIMDYGGCLIMFTLGQKAVMQAAMQMPCRTSLWSQSNLIATGTADNSVTITCAPTPDFIANHTRVCVGQPIQLTNLTYNAQPDSTSTWVWQVTGPDSVSFTTQNPLVTLTNPGVYSVSLTAANSAGNNTLSKANYLHVMATTTALQAPVSESFERAAFPDFPTNPDKSWRIENSSTNTWQRVNTAALDSTYSMRIRHQAIGQNQTNALVTANINLAGIAQPVLQFSYAYAPSVTNPSATDIFRVLSSADCGQTWVMHLVKSGANLATAPAASTSFAPSANQWQTATVMLPASSPYLQLKFETISGTGNSLYLDAVRVVDATQLAATETAHLQGLEIFPNPSFGKAVLRYQLPAETPVQLRVISATGKVVATQTDIKLPGTHEQNLQQICGTLPSGIYLVQLSAGAQTQTIKLAVQ